MKILAHFILLFFLQMIIGHNVLADTLSPLVLRKNLENKGIVTEVVYTADYFANTKGGLKHDDTIMTNLDITVEVDTEQLGLWDNGKMFFYFLDNSGSDKLTGSIVGDLQTVSNIEAPRSARLYELWYEHLFFDDTLSVLLGFHDYNSEFNVTEYGGLYINSSFGIQPDISGSSRPSIFPLAALGLRMKIIPDDQWEVLFAVYDGDPGDPDVSEHFPRSDFDSDGGVLLAGEAIYHFSEDDFSDFLKVGVWHNSGDFNDIVDSDFGGTLLIRDGNTGGYLVIDKKLYREVEEQGLGAFIQFGANDKRINEVNFYVGGGLNYRGLIPHRDDDEIGVAVAHAFINDDLVDAGGRDDYESVIEMTYSAQINDYFRIQPDFQYIINPGGTSGVENAFVVGLRVEIIL